MSRRIRSLKPELTQDVKIAELSDTAFRLFIGAITFADDKGTFRADRRQLEKDIYWAVPPTTPVPAAFTELVTKGLVTPYSVRGQDYARFVNWGKHQRIDNAGKTGLLPGPEESAANRRETPPFAAGSGSGSGSGPGGDLDAPAREEPVQTPEQAAADVPLPPPASESDYDLGRRIFIEAWEKKYHEQWFSRQVQLGGRDDDHAFQEIGRWAREHGNEDAELFCKHLVAQFLRDHGTKGRLDEEKHPPKWIVHSIRKYGAPQRRRQAPPESAERLKVAEKPVDLAEMARRAADAARRIA